MSATAILRPVAHPCQGETTRYCDSVLGQTLDVCAFGGRWAVSAGGVQCRCPVRDSGRFAGARPGTGATRHWIPGTARARAKGWREAILRPPRVHRQGLLVGCPATRAAGEETVLRPSLEQRRCQRVRARIGRKLRTYAMESSGVGRPTPQPYRRWVARRRSWVTQGPSGPADIIRRPNDRADPSGITASSTRWAAAAWASSTARRTRAWVATWR